MQSLGNHLIVELYDCDSALINNVQQVEQVLLTAVELSGAKTVQSVIHEFNPHGVSGVIVIEESHFSVHTWPEFGYLTLDVYLCNYSKDNSEICRKIFKGISSLFKPKKIIQRLIER